MSPYYEHAGISIYLGDCREILPTLGKFDLLLTDPPYGIAYQSGRDGALPRSIVGDDDTSLRDHCIASHDGACLVFGSWKVTRPFSAHTLLIWDTKGALGMGDLSVPWKPSHQEIYVIGHGFTGQRTTDVLSFAPVQSTAANGRLHPHQKPAALMVALLGKCPAGWTIVDPFMGSGTTLRAAKDLGRRAVGIEIEERYCEIAAKRLAQEVMFA